MEDLQLHNGAFLPQAEGFPAEMIGHVIVACTYVPTARALMALYAWRDTNDVKTDENAVEWLTQATEYARLTGARLQYVDEENKFSCYNRQPCRNCTQDILDHFLLENSIFPCCCNYAVSIPHTCN